MKKLFILCGAALLFTQDVMAQSFANNSSSISLGIVNGDIVNNKIKIEKVLNNPTVLSVMQNKLKLPLKTLFVNDASLLKSQQGKVTFIHRSPLKENSYSVKTQASLELWLDGYRANLEAKQENLGVKLIIPTEFKTLELRVIEPVELYFPRDYQGDFMFSLDINGYSN